jgi:RNA polymerase sigma factor (sigma-70 family)
MFTKSGKRQLFVAVLPFFLSHHTRGCRLQRTLKGVPNASGNLFVLPAPRPSGFGFLLTTKIQNSEVIMKTTYLVWKDPSCGGVSPDWQEISGKAFLAIVRSNESKGRYFVRLGSSELDGSDGEVVMESTKTYFDEWKREKNRADYLRGLSKDFTTLSYHSLDSDDGSYGEELLEDEYADTESECLLALDKQTLAEALTVLTEDEHRLIALLYLSAERRTEREIADIFGISQQLLSYRKKAVLKKLRKKFGD